MKILPFYTEIIDQHTFSQEPQAMKCVHLKIHYPGITILAGNSQHIIRLY